MTNLNELTLDQATHANHYSYSDITPFEIIRKVGAKTIEIRRMKSKLINGDELKFHVGGFAANCSNQNIQKYEYSSDETMPVERVRLQKDGTWKDKYGCKYRLDTKPVRFYDYNF